MSEVPKSIKASLYIDGKPAENSIKDVNQVAMRLKRELDGLTAGTDAWVKKSKELQNVRAYLSKLKEEAYGVGDAFHKVRETIGELSESVAIGTLISQAIRGALEGIKEFIQGTEAAYEDYSNTQAAIINKLKQTGYVAGETKDKLDEYAHSISEQTGIETEVIQKGEEMLLSYTNIRGYIYQKAIPAVVDLAKAQNNGKVTMQGMSTAAEYLARALDKPTAAKRELRELGIDLSNEQQKEIKNLVAQNKLQQAQSIILDEVNNRYGHLATTLSSTAVGAMERYEDKTHSLAVTIGQWEVSGRRLYQEVLEPFLDWLDKATKTTLPEKLAEEQEGLNSLVDAIVSTNQDQTIRNQLIKELQEKYPDFIGNINKEAATNELLARRLEEANQQYVQKIFIATNQDKITEIQEKLNKSIREEADARERVAKASGLSISQLAQLSDAQIKALAAKQATQDEEGRSAMDPESSAWASKRSSDDLDIILNGRKKQKAAFAEIADLEKANAVMQQKLTDAQVAGINKEIAALEKKKKAEKSAKEAAIDQSEINRLIQQRKLAQGIVEAPVSEPDGKGSGGVNKQEEIQRRILAYKEHSKQLSEQVMQFNATELADTMAKNDKEVKSVQGKYDAEINKLQSFISKSYGLHGKLNKDANIDEVKKHEDEIAALKINKDKEVNAVIERQHQELIAKMQAFNDQISGKIKSAYEREKDAINKFYDDQKKNAGNNQHQQADIELNRHKALNAAKLNDSKAMQDELLKLQQEGDKILGKGKSASIDDQIKAVRKGAADEITALKQKFSKEDQMTQTFKDMVNQINKNADEKVSQLQKEKTKHEEQQAISDAQRLSGELFSLIQRGNQQATNDKLNQLEKQRSAELSNTNLTASQKQAINASFDKQEAEIKKKQFEAQKALSAEQVLMNAAVGILKLWVDPGFPEATPLAIALGAQAAAQEALILSQPTPAFATGGFSDSEPAGYINQPMVFRNSASGRPFAAGEAGAEWIAPNWMVNSPGYANIIGMLESARQEKRAFASGGFTGSAPAGTGYDPARLERMEALLDTHTQLFQKQAEINEKPITLNYRTFDIYAQKVATVKNIANA